MTMIARIKDYILETFLDAPPFLILIHPLFIRTLQSDQRIGNITMK